MQPFADFFKDKLGNNGSTIDVHDIDDYHLLLEVSSGHERSKSEIADNMLIPLISRFLLVCSDSDPDPSSGIMVQKITNRDRYVVFMKQGKRDHRFVITISITAVIE